MTSLLAQSPELEWAKQFGGSLGSQGNGIAVDDFSNVYTTGYFRGTFDFDPGPNTFNLVSPERFDIFLSNLDVAGNFLWAKAMTGTSFNAGEAIAVDDQGNVYTTGNFSSNTADFDPGPGVFSLIKDANVDSNIFISKLDNNGNFVWAKKLGRTLAGFPKAITIDFEGNVVIAGDHGGGDFDPGPGVTMIPTYGSHDIFVSKLDSDGNFIWARSMGGIGIDKCFSIAIDKTGNIYTTGEFSETADFDPGPAVFSLSSMGDCDVFATKLDASGNFVWAKQVGGVNRDIGHSITLDNYDKVYITGDFQGNVDFDPGAEAFVLSEGGIIGSSFISILDIEGQFVWAGKLESISNSTGQQIKTDNYANIYSVGHFTTTTDFDPGPASSSLTSVNSSDIYVHKMRQCLFSAEIRNEGAQSFCAGDSLLLSASLTQNIPVSNYNWSSGDSTENVLLFPDSNSMYTVTITYSAGCTSTDTISVTVFPSPSATISGDLEICAGESTLLTTPINIGATYLWNTGADSNSLIANPLTTETFSVTITDANDCTASDSITIFVYDLPNPIISGSTEICPGDSTTLSAEGGLTYSWSVDNNTNTVLITPSVNTTYTVTVTDANNCTAADSITVLLYNLPDPIIRGNLEICPGDTTTLIAEGGISYLWNTNNNTNTILVIPSSDTEYSVTVTDENGCTSASSAFVILDEMFCSLCATLPNAFTPDADGRNDVFRVLPGEDIEVLDFRIFNRWGDLVHNSVQPWDGRWQGKPQPMELYIYVVRVQSHCGVEELTGEVTLIR